MLQTSESVVTQKSGKPATQFCAESLPSHTCLNPDVTVLHSRWRQECERHGRALLGQHWGNTRTKNRQPYPISFNTTTSINARNIN